MIHLAEVLLTDHLTRKVIDLLADRAWDSRRLAFLKHSLALALSPLLALVLRAENGDLSPPLVEVLAGIREQKVLFEGVEAVPLEDEPL